MFSVLQWQDFHTKKDILHYVNPDFRSFNIPKLTRAAVRWVSSKQAQTGRQLKMPPSLNISNLFLNDLIEEGNLGLYTYTHIHPSSIGLLNLLTVSGKHIASLLLALSSWGEPQEEALGCVYLYTSHPYFNPEPPGPGLCILIYLSPLL